ncbi:MAG: carbon storage regulator [Sulfuricaulis sp.]
MLKLTRRRGDGFHLGENIHIKVVSVIKGVVTVGIDAPKDINIERDELRARKKAKAVAESQVGSTEEGGDALVVP